MGARECTKWIEKSKEYKDYDEVFKEGKEKECCPKRNVKIVEKKCPCNQYKDCSQESQYANDSNYQPNRPCENCHHSFNDHN